MKKISLLLALVIVMSCFLTACGGANYKAVPIDPDYVSTRAENPNQTINGIDGIKVSVPKTINSIVCFSPEAAMVLRELGAKEKKLFYTIGALVYYENLERFFFEKFSDDENAKAFIIAIFEAEYSYFKYLENTEMAEYLDSYKERMMSAISYYALILDHNTRDSYLLDTYRYYTQIYYELISD